MREEEEEERGVKGRKLGGGRICSMDMFGMDIFSTTHSGLCIIRGMVP